MSKFQAVHKYFALFLALLAFNGSLIAYGRKIIKPLNQNSSPNTPTHHTLPFYGPIVHLPPPPPTTSPPQKTEPSMTQNYGSKTSFEDSGDDHYSNAFRPTTPGGSPGVGHPKSAADQEHVKDFVAAQKSPVVEDLVNVDASRNDFRPTDPGNSPGVGHAQHNKMGN